jgi:cytochrome P450
LGLLSLDILGRSVLGFDARTEADDVGEMVGELTRFARARLWGLIPPRLWFATPGAGRFYATRRRLLQRLESLIAVHRSPSNDASDDLVSTMLSARDEWGQPMSDRQLRDELTTLYLAGHETTARLLTAVFYALAHEPDVERQLHAELDAHLAGRTPTLADLPALPYTRAVVDEALRLYPPVPVLTKHALQDDVVDGYRVVGGALVVLSPYLTQRHPDVWPEPERFDPGRFVSAAAAGRRHRFAVFPFSAGSHSCPGASFALQEARLAVAAIASRFRLLPASPEQPGSGVRQCLELPNVHLRLVARPRASARRMPLAAVASN